MRVEGRYEFRASRQEVWKALQDPELLAVTLPGAKSLEVVGPDRYRIVADVGVGSVKGRYEGTFGLEDKKDLESVTMRGSARGGAGSIEVDAHSRLSDADHGGTLLTYEAQASVAGPIAGVGQRMIAAASKRMAGDFFGAIDRDLAGERVPAAVPEAKRPAEVGRVYTRPPAPPMDVKTFATGVLVGFGLAIIGVAVGHRTARRR